MIRRNEPNVDFVVFDLDGTLVDSRKDIAQAVNYGLETVGGSRLDEKMIYPLIGVPLEDIFLRLLPGELREHAEAASEVYRKYYFEHCADNTTVYDGVLECLDKLSPLPLAIATTKMTFQARQVVEKLGLSSHFKVIMGCDNIPHKPHPAVLHLVVAALKMDGASGLMVGDTIYDIQAGQAASMLTCAVTYGIGSLEDLESANPDVLVSTLAQLPAVLEK